MSLDGVALYSDHNHLTKRGAKTILIPLLEESLSGSFKASHLPNPN
jgi:hypothetical protein